jgi:primase-polymerase (primpol)-like protein
VGYLPQGLISRPQWMVWRAELRPGGRWGKAPRDPRTLQLASKTDPHAWGTIYEARDAVLARGMTGLGFVLTAGDPFVMLDPDDCVDPETLEIEPWARALIAELRTYTEYSASRTGIRIVAKGSLRANHKGARLEMYHDGAFLALTGHPVPGTPATIHERTAALRAIEDREFPQEPAVSAPPVAPPACEEDAALIQRALAASNGDGFRRLWEGRWQGLCPSQSEGDWRLCLRLIYCYGTYGRRTLERAIAEARARRRSNG